MYGDESDEVGVTAEESDDIAKKNASEFWKRGLLTLPPEVTNKYVSPPVTAATGSRTGRAVLG